MVITGAQSALYDALSNISVLYIYNNQYVMKESHNSSDFFQVPFYSR